MRTGTDLIHEHPGPSFSCCSRTSSVVSSDHDHSNRSPCTRRRVLIRVHSGRVAWQKPERSMEWRATQISAGTATSHPRMKCCGKQHMLLPAAALLFLLCLPAAAHEHDLHISASRLQQRDGEPIALVKGWKYHPGDDPRYADPHLDDSDWERIPTPRMSPGRYPTSGFEGIGWFRLTLRVDSSLWNETLALDFLQPGASEIYLNGRLVYSFGRVTGDKHSTIEDRYFLPRPRLWTFDAKPVQVIAVRYANWMVRDIRMMGGSSGFRFALGLPHASIQHALDHHGRHYGTLLSFLGLTVALFILHLLLYVYDKSVRENLFFSLMAAGIGLMILGLFQLRISGTGLGFYISYTWLRIAMVVLSIFAIRFMMEVRYKQALKWFWWVPAIGVVIVLLTLWTPQWVYYLYTMASILIALVLMLLKRGRRPRGYWIITMGMVLFGMFSIYNILMDMRLLPDITERMILDDPFLFGVLALMLSMSVYLARQVGFSNQRLREQLIEIQRLNEQTLEAERRMREEELQRQKLELENKRKEQELEEARRRQKLMEQLERTNRELRDTQAQLTQSEKMASLGMLTAGVAHEINTPVGAIHASQNTLHSALEKLRGLLKEEYGEGFEEKPQAKRVLRVLEDSAGVIQQGSKRVNEIVKRLRSFARLDEAELKAVNINEGLEDTLVMVYHELKDNIEVVKDYGDIPAFNCFPGLLNQVFLNLIMNAVQAMDESGGTLTLQTRHEESRASIRISDTGTGIREDNLSKIFDPGFTTKGVGVGTGLGLSIVYRIVEQHNGKVTVESMKGEGTTFTVVLPMDLSESDIVPRNRPPAPVK
ncbi:GHKL domain-containing protein [bacterium]|nr:GHKL domain-containing protein [bacterium]